MDENYIYTYNEDELREILEKISKGITVLMSPELESDLQMYQLQLESEIMDNEDDIEEFKRNHSELMKKKLEQKKRQATQTDVIVIELSDAQKQQLREDMEVSIVRNNPDLSYHKTDDELYGDEEKKEIYQKLSKLQKCYYNQHDYVNAVKIIFEAIRYSLKHDYPYMSYEEACREFNKGRIKFEYCQLPKLYLNWTTIVDDPATLKGILNGTVTVITKEDDDMRKKKKLPVEAQRYEVEVTGVNEWNMMSAMHQRGIDTPISPVIQAVNGTFSRFALPSNNFFHQSKMEEKRAPVEFDWMQEGAGIEYYNLLHDVKYTTGDLLDDLNRANRGNLNHSLQSDIDAFVNDLKWSSNQKTGCHNIWEGVSMVQTKDQKTVQLEQSILQAMRNANPNK
jgi:hypothetical protein